MSTETIVYLILAGIIALFLALFQYFYKSKFKSRLSYTLVGLRALSIFALLVLLINPKLEKYSYYEVKPHLLVAIDNSESVTYLKQDQNTKALVESLKSNAKLNAKFDIQYYTFGTNVSANSELSFKDTQTNPSLLFEQLSQAYRHSIAPIVFISDGNQTIGADYQHAAIKFNQPIYSVILGDTIQYIDLKIEQLNVNRYAYSKNQFPVEIIATYNGAEAVRSTLKITTDDTTVFSQVLNFSAASSSQMVTAMLPANSVGVKSYKAELIALDNERNIVNNIKNFAIEVIDQKTNVAIVSDIIHPDLGALKKAIESNEQRQAKILKSNEFLKESLDYQLAIIYQPGANLKSVFDKIETLNINTFWIVGSHTHWSSFNASQDYFNQQITNQTEDFQPSLNSNYSTFSIDELDFSDFPPLQSEFGELKINQPYETLLYKNIYNKTTAPPLLASYDINSKKGAILLGEGLWKWRLQSYVNTQSFENFDNFIGKLVQYLSTNTQRSRLNIDYESFYTGSGNIKIKAQYFNKNYEFDPNGSLNLELTDTQTKKTKTFPLLIKNYDYEVDLSGIEAGDYNFEVKSQAESISKTGSFKVIEYNVEQQFLNANFKDLQNLSKESEGISYFIDDTQQLTNNLIDDSRFVSVQKNNKSLNSLLDWPCLLLIIITSLTAEWLIRKYNGLI